MSPWEVPELAKKKSRAAQPGTELCLWDAPSLGAACLRCSTCSGWLCGVAAAPPKGKPVKPHAANSGCSFSRGCQLKTRELCVQGGLLDWLLAERLCRIAVTGLHTQNLLAPWRSAVPPLCLSVRGALQHLHAQVGVPAVKSPPSSSCPLAPLFKRSQTCMSLAHHFLGR